METEHIPLPPDFLEEEIIAPRIRLQKLQA